MKKTFVTYSSCLWRNAIVPLILMVVSLFTHLNANGQTGAALSFDGVNDIVTVNNTLGNFGTSDFTVEGYFKTSSATNQNIISKRSACSHTNFWNVYVSSNGNVVFEVDESTTGTNYNAIVSTTTYRDGNWHHFAAVRSAYAISLYVDGVFLDSKATTGITNLNNTTNLIIGNNACNNYFKGSLDAIRLWNRALPVCEITNHLACEQFSITTGLLASYNFNQGTGGGSNTGQTTLTDNSGNNNSGTLSGFALTGATSNWVSPGAVTTNSACALPSARGSNYNISGTSICQNQSITFTPKSYCGQNTGALELNDGSYAIASPNTTNKLATNVDNFSMEIWVNWKGVNAAASDQVIFYNGYIHQNGYGITCDKNGLLKIYLGLKGELISNLSLQKDVWQHVAISRTSGNWNIYKNGELGAFTGFSAGLNSGTAPNATANGINDRIVFGVVYGTASENRAYFNGIIDEAKLKFVAQSQADIRSSMAQCGVNSSFTEDYVYWPFDQSIFTSSPAQSTYFSIDFTQPYTPFQGQFPVSINGPASFITGTGNNAPTGVGVTNWLFNDGTTFTQAGNNYTRQFTSGGSFQTVMQVTNGSNTCEVFTYDTSIKVETLKTPTITVSSIPSIVDYGSAITSSVANINFGGAAPKYQWQVNGVNGAFPSTASTFSNTPANGDVITCNLTSNYACLATATVTSNTIAAQVIHRQAGALSIDDLGANIDLGTTLGNFGTDNFTVEAYFKVNTSGARQAILSKRANCSGNSINYWNVLMMEDGKLRFEVNWVSNIYPYTAYYSVINTVKAYNESNGVWHKVSAVRDGRTIRMYVDGKDVVSTTGTNTANIYNSTSLSIGYSPCTNGFIGKIDEVYIWNRALDSCEINSHLSCESNFNQAGLLAYYNFNQGFEASSNTTETTLKDVTGNGYNGTLNAYFDLTSTNSSSNWCFPGAVTSGVTCSASNIALVSNSSTANQTVYQNVPLDSIIYNTIGATGATVIGLPTGVSANWSNQVLTISGKPTVAGSFDYTINLSGICGTTSGTITIKALALDGLNAGAAYSLRKIKTGYSGFAVRVLRKSDNVQKDIGFTADGDLAVDTVTAFLGTSDGYIAIWYDQTGSTRHLNNNDTSRMPLLANKGVIYRVNGKPAAYFDGNSRYLRTSSDATWLSGTAYALNAVADANVLSAGSSSFLMGTVGNSNDKAISFGLIDNATTGQDSLTLNQFNDGTSVSVKTPTDVAVYTALVNANLRGSLYYLNSGLVSTNTTPTANLGTTGVFCLGTNNDTTKANTKYWKGYIAEALVYNSSFAAQRLTVEQDQLKYYVQNTLDKVNLPATSKATAAYGLRLLSSSYTGKAIQVRNGNTNALLDIGFTVNGDLDTTAIKTFIGTGGAWGYISKWYDQSGNGIDASQINDWNQPLIFFGKITRLGSQPSALIDGTKLVATLPYLPSNSPHTLNAVASVTDANASIVSISSTAAVNQNSMLGGNLNGLRRAGWYGGYNQGVNFVGKANYTNAIGIRTKSYAFSRTKGYYNLVQDYENNSTTYNLTNSSIGLGGVVSGQSFYGGNLSEAIILLDTLSDADRLAMETNQRYYYAPPSISAFSPIKGPVGTLVTIVGSNFYKDLSVKIGGVSAVKIYTSSTLDTVIAMVMPGATNGIVQLLGVSNANSTGSYTVENTAYPKDQQRSKIVGTGGLEDAGQGYAVSLSADGNTALVGGSTNKGGEGAAWVFTRVNGIWKQQGSVLKPFNGYLSGFGSSVSLSADGNIALIGGFTEDAGRGAAWVFKRIDTSWSYSKTLQDISTTSATAYQGSSVSLSADGKTALVGGYNDSTVGASWIYACDDNGNWSLSKKIVGTGSVGSAQQGYSVALSSDASTAIIGGNQDNGGQGAVWIFRKTNGTWVQQGSKITNSTGTNANQGSAVALSADGNIALIGAPSDSSYKGAAWLYVYNGSAWVQQSKLIGTKSVGFAQQGYSLGLSADGNTAVIGGFLDSSNVGAAWVYSKVGSTWVQQGNKLVGGGMSGSAYFGNAAAISSDATTAIFGGNFDSSGVGASWVFTAAPNEPSIAYFTPTKAPTGSIVTIKGSSFSDVTNVRFGGVNASNIKIIDAYTIQATVANGASGAIIVTNPKGSDTLTGFTYLPCAHSAKTIQKVICPSSFPYTWNGNAYSVPGTYVANLTSYQGCDSIVTLVLKADSVPANISGNIAGCASISLTALGGVSYSWSGGTTPNGATNVFTTSGTYTVTVTDSINCTASVTRTITVYPLPVVNISGSLIGCDSTKLTATGGITYQWNSDPIYTIGTKTFTTNGTNTVLVTDQNGCSTSKSATVTISKPATLTIDGNTSGCQTVSLTSSLTGTKYLYSWSGGNNISSASNSIDSSGSYVLSVEDTVTGCISKDTITITILPLPTVVISGEDTACGTVNLTASGGSSYVWSGGAPKNTASNNFNQSGNYSVTVTGANGCAASQAVSVKVNPTPVLSLIQSNNGCGNVYLTAKVQGGRKYKWNVGTDSLTATINTPTSGTYSVSVTDSNNCTISGSKTITVGTQKNLKLVNNKATTCVGTAELTTVGAVGADYIQIYKDSTYRFTTPSLRTVDSIALLFVDSSGAEVTYKPKAYGNYWAVANFSDGCNAVSPIFTVNIARIGIVGADTGCLSLPLVVTGGKTAYNWSGGTTSTLVTNTFTNLGTYAVSVTATDSNSCVGTATKTIVIRNATPPTASISGTATSCDSVVLTASGGVQYLWTGGTKPNAATNVFKEDGLDSVKVTAANGCSVTVSQQVTIKQSPTAFIPGISSECGKVVLTAGGGGTYLWNTGLTPTLATNTFTTGGKYVARVTVTSANGCTAKDSLRIQVNTIPYITTSNDSVGCGSVTLTVKGGNSFRWSGGSDVFEATNTFITSGTYTVTTVDTNGCTASRSFPITVNPRPTAAFTGTTTGVGSVTLVASGGSTYVWGGGKTPNAATNTFSSIGTYTIPLTVKNAQGCSDSTSALITVSANPNIGTNQSLAAAAYSVRLLWASYTGKALQVRRSSDNSILDIGFTTNGDLDTSALKNFIGTDSAFVTKWYDQSGNGRDVAQTIAGSQPRIAKAGVIDRVNGSVAIYYQNDSLINGSTIFTQYPIEMKTISSITGNTNGAFVKIGNSTTGIGLGVGSSTFDNSGSNIVGLKENVAWMPTSQSIVANTLHAFGMSVPVGSSTSVAYYDGNSISFNSGQSSPPNQPTANLNIGGYLTRSPSHYSSEILLFPSQLSASVRSSIDSNQAQYYNLVQPVINSQPSTTTRTICIGTTSTALSVTATNAATYQWYINTANSNTGGVSISGATASSYTPSSSVVGTSYYYVVVSNVFGVNLTSNVSGAYVIVGKSNAGTIGGATAICVGSGSAVSLSLDQFTGTLQWQSSTNNTTFSNISGANSFSYTASGLSNTTYYRVIASNGVCTNDTAKSVAIVVNQNNTITLNSAIATQNQTVCVNNSISSITYTTTGATDASFSGLPFGVTGDWTNNVVTISGIPNVAGNYTYTVSLYGGCGTISATGTITVKTYLDKLSLVCANKVAGAYSLRLLSTGYTAKAITVRRSSDNSIQDIGFTANGDLDTTALKSFVGNNMGYVTKWYDQSGNGKDVAQATNSSQPRIVNNGVIDRLNGNVAIYFASNNLVNTNSNMTAYPLQIHTVSGITSTTKGAIVKIGGSSNGIGLGIGINDLDNQGNKLVALKELVAWMPTNQFVETNSLHLLGVQVAANSAATSYYDSIQPTITNGAKSNAIAPDNNLYIGGYASRFPTHYTSEVIILSESLSTANINSLVNNQTTYYQIGKPVITVQPSSVPINVCLGGTLSPLTVTATGSGLTYQWFSNTTNANSGGTSISGATNASYIPSSSVSGTVYYYVVVTASNGFSTVSSVATVTTNASPTNTINLSSALNSDAQTVCISNPISNITYNTTNATGANIAGLPSGVLGNWSGNVYTISGAPTVSGSYPYTITLTGGCGTVTKTGTITVNNNNTIGLSSAVGTDAQTVNVNALIATISYNTTGATGSNITGLPSGVTGNWSNNIVTISGSPTQVGSYNYTITLTGGCGIISKTGSLTVNPIAPTIGTFSNITKNYGDAAFTLTAPSSNSSGTFSYGSSNTNVATISGNTVTIVGIGTATITATQAASGNYLSGTKTATLIVNAVAPTIGTFSNITKNFGDVAFGLTAPTSNSAGAFTYASSNTSVATISGSTVTIVGAGTATITATQAANGNYTSGSTTATLTVNTIAPTIGTFNNITKNYGDAAFILTAPTSNSSGGFTYASSNTSVATIIGSTVTIVGAGTATITATQAANGNYTSGITTATLTVNTIAPTIGTFSNISKNYGDAAFTLTAPSSNSSGTFSYGSSNTSVATISGNTVTIVGIGTATITATQAALGNYNAGSRTATLTVNAIAPTIGTFSNITKNYGDAAFTLTAPSSNSSGSFSFGSSNTNVATISGNIVTIVGAGTATITANQAANGNYLSATKTTTLTVNKATLTITAANQSVTFGTMPIVVTGAGTYLPTGFKNGDNTASISGTVTYTTNYTPTTAPAASGIVITPIVSGLAASNYTFIAASGIITVLPSTDARLSALTLSAGTLSPVFSGNTTTYTASVSNSTTSITVTPTVYQANATVTVNETTVTSGTASGAINLNVGSNTITTVVTAQDGTTSKTYTITVTRACANTSSTTNATACDSYLWNGVNYTNTGNYSKTFIGGNSQGCDSVATLHLVITPSVTPSVSISATSVILSMGDKVVFTATPVNGGSNPVYQWKKNGNNVGTNSITYTDSSFSNNDIITVTLSPNNTCQTSNVVASNGITLTVVPAITWTGTVSTDWNNPNNWNTHSVPTSADNTIIPSVPVNQPKLTSNTTIKGMILNGSLSLNGKTATLVGTVSGTGTINSTNQSSIIVNGNAGTLLFNAANNSLANLTLTTGSVTVGNALNVTGTLIIASGILNTGDFLTLKSTSIANSAIVGQVGGTINGNVTVERYIPKGYRAWRDLAPQVYNAGSMFNNWQEGGNYTNGSGIFITGGVGNPSGTVNGMDGNGFDQTVNAVKSAYSYPNGIWTAISNTKTTILNPFTGYRVLVRGDRFFNLFTQPISTVGTTGMLLMVNATKVRTKGALVTGDVVYNKNGVTNSITGSTYTNAAYGLSSSTDSSFSLVANPYVCPIDWQHIYDNNGLSNLRPTYYYLDPTLGSNGAYVVYNAFSQTASNGSANTRYIQAGQAFFVQNNSSTNPSLTIKEANKAVASTKTAVFGTANKLSKLQFGLWKDAIDHVQQMDAATWLVNSAFSNGIGQEDALKLKNSSNNLSIVEGSQHWSIAGCKNVTEGDSIAIGLGQLDNGHYELRIDATNFYDQGVTPMLYDAVNNSYSSLSTTTPTTIGFEGSSNIGNRFKIVFKKAVKLTPYPSPLITIFPNPAKGAYTVQLPTVATNQRYSVTVYSVDGKAVRNEQKIIPTEANTLRLTTKGLTSGVYQLKVQGDDGAVWTVRLQVGD